MIAGARLKALIGWRMAGAMLLLAGIAFALWRDPALLDAPGYWMPLVAGFALLVSVPRLQALQADRAARRDAAPVVETAPPSPLPAVALGVGIGLVAGGVVLAVPGLFGLLGRWKLAVLDALFSGRDLAGAALAVAATLGLLFALNRVSGALMAVLRRSRLAAGVMIGLVLWLPLAPLLGPLAAQFGLPLPGLQDLTGGPEQNGPGLPAG